MNHFSRYRSSFFVGLIFLVVTLGIFGFYQTNTLEGSINNHMLSSEMFGIPDQLKAHGLTPLYGPTQSGWDGQFYYYMSNDIMGIKDTAKHIDAPSYRYQRIGLSLYAAAVAKLGGSDWVSPASFFFSYLALLCAATVAGAYLFKRFGAHPAWILLWSFSIGTQITLFNALPDAAADAFLILALALLFSGRLAWSVIPFAMAALSREVYAAFPAAVLLFHVVDSMRAAHKADQPLISHAITQTLRSRYYLLVIPALIAVVWNLRVTHHFGASPASQAHGILGLPLRAWWHSLVHALHTVTPEQNRIPREVVSLVLFLLVLIAALAIAIRTLRHRDSSPALRGVALGAAFFVVLYSAFGPTVTGDYTGYFKAVAVFFYLIPLMVAMAPLSRGRKAVVYGLLLVALFYTSVINLKVRILTSNFNEEQYTHMSGFTEDRRFECFGKYEAKMHVNSTHLIKAEPLASLYGRRDRIVMNVALTNAGTHTFISTHNFGGVFMSFHWLDATGKVVLDGTRSALLKPIAPGETENVDIVTMIPTGFGPVTLKLSPVQEGCSWFYQSNPEVTSDMVLTSNR